MKLMVVLFAMLAVVAMAALPVFGNVIPQCPPVETAAQGGSYPITDLRRNAQNRPVNYNLGRRY
ncbi:uncharacterized protein LOC108105774 [Drosophila eugracilis]|uniref:uncharacterized protein LOC108105774 n=1 Tax=Drosophila eugracilis TaxID=29029 RepID=UPI0007E7ACBD|nr:uncharacterized protein LOC108105774 [Drosophila eugracilis]